MHASHIQKYTSQNSSKTKNKLNQSDDLGKHRSKTKNIEHIDRSAQDIKQRLRDIYNKR